jgi:HD-GYP domain-containing protein (c-di-GMP phosphodiesterase class II)
MGRPYRKGVSNGKAVETIHDETGTNFDPMSWTSSFKRSPIPRQSQRSTSRRDQQGCLMARPSGRVSAEWPWPG